MGFVVHVSGFETWGGLIGIGDWGEDRLRIATVDGSMSVEFPDGVGSRGIMNGQLSDPVGFVVDDAGRFFVLDAGNSRVQAFHGARYLTKWGSQGDGPGEFNLIKGEPKGDIALDRRGNIYVVDSFNGRIQKFGP